VTALYHSYILPWTKIAQEARRLLILVVVFLFIGFVLGLIIPFIPVPKEIIVDNKPPDNLVEFIERKKKEPPPPPPPPKPPEKKPEKKAEKKPEPKKEPKKEPPKPKEKSLEELQQEAKKKAQATFANMFGDELDIKPDVKLNTKPLNKNSGKEKTDFQRDMLVASNISSGSGGIDTSNISTGIGTTKLSGRETTKVSSGIEKLAKHAAESGGGGKSKTRAYDEITMVMEGNKSRIFNFYNRYLRKDPTLAGKIVFELVIDPSGRVVRVKILSSELNSPELESKLTALLKSLNFGSKDVDETTVEYPIDFLPPS